MPNIELNLVVDRDRAELKAWFDEIRGDELSYLRSLRV